MQNLTEVPSDYLSSNNSEDEEFFFIKKINNLENLG